MSSLTSVSADTATPGAEARGATRLPFRSMATARAAGASARFQIEFRDLSRSGFSYFSGANLACGQIIYITIPGLAATEARVVWRRDRYYGCAFTYPLHQAVFDYIIAHFRAG